MNMQKIIVIGSAGAGKSTFARKLRDITGLPLYYLDMIWHRADKTTIPREEFNEILDEITKTERWIIDGNYHRTLKTRLQVCDTAFFLDIPSDECLAGAEARIGKQREDIPWLETEFDKDFKQWILDFPQKRLPLIRELLDEFREEKNIITFTSRKAADEFLNELKKNL